MSEQLQKNTSKKRILTAHTDSQAFHAAESNKKIKLDVNSSSRSPSFSAEDCQETRSQQLNSNTDSTVQEMVQQANVTKEAKHPSDMDQVNAERKVPRYYADSKNIILSAYRQKLFSNIIKKEIKDKNKDEAMKSLFHLEVKSSDNFYTDEVILSAPRKIMDNVITKFDKLFSDSIQMYNISKMNWVQIVIKLDTSGAIGASGYDIGSETENKIGLMIISAKEGSELKKVMGNAANTGMCISNIDGKKVTTTSEVKDAWLSVKKSGAKYSKVTCSLPNCNLSSISPDRIVSKVYFDPSSNDTVNTSNCTVISDNNKNSNIALDVLSLDKKKSCTDAVVFHNQSIPKVLPTQSNGKNEIAATPTNVTSDTADKTEGWNNFRTKYNPVCDIEYQKTIKKVTALGSMWKVHKTLYGAECDEDCLCVSDLNKLCENVLQELRKTKKSNNQVGFVSFFCPKFYSKIKNSYPSLSPSDILEKLFRMWKKHTCVARYGWKCSADCECEELWESIFIPNCLGPIESSKNSPIVNTMKSVPKKRTESQSSKTPLVRLQKVQRKNSVLTANKQTTSKAVQLAPKVSLLSKISIPASNSFFMQFDTFKPLGMCLITKKSGESTVCKILSICPKGQASGNSRIKTGLVVKNVTINNSNAIKILTHSMLKKIFNDAKERGQQIRLHIVPGNDDSDCKGNYWTETGDWKGAVYHLSYWAGGSQTIFPANYKEKKSIANSTLAKKSDCSFWLFYSQNSKIH